MICERVLINTVNKSSKILRNICCRTLSIDYHPNIVKSSSSDVAVPDVTISEFILPKIEKYSKFSALESLTTGRKLTFGQVRIKSKNLNKALRHIFKLKAGDVVAILLSNRPEFFVSCLGILEAGLIITTLSPIYTAEEISKQLLDSSAKVIITQVDYVKNAENAIKLVKRHLPIISVKFEQNDSLPNGTIDFEDLCNSNFDVPEPAIRKKEEVAFLPYSSGTTGLPKGVQLTHRNLVANACQTAHEDFNNAEPPTESYQDVTAGILPLYHIYGFAMNFVQTFLNGSKCVTVEKFSSASCISLLKNHKVSLLYVAPPAVMFLATNDDIKPEYLKHLKCVISGGAPLGPFYEEKLLEKMGKQNDRPFMQAYGMTETSPMVTMGNKKMKKTDEDNGSCGVLISNTFAKIVDPNDPLDTPLPRHKSGELLVKGPQLMKGYYKNEKATKEIMSSGWLRTGDIGHFNQNNLLFITDRLKELIKVKGFQVAPAELEEVILKYPSVQDAAIVGVPHPKYGEVPRAYIVTNDKNLNVNDLANYVNNKVANYKRLLGGVEVVNSIPKTLSGKKLRRQLKSSFIEREKHV